VAGAGIDARPSHATFPGYNGRLVFTNVSDPGEKIVLINPNGAFRQELTGGAARDTGPAWSPDGSKIAFSRGINPGAIYTMNADGTGLALVSQNAIGIDDYAPSWSPDGTKIAFSSYRTGHSEIWAMNLDGSGATVLTDSKSTDTDPSWSPDGEQIAFTSTRDGNWEIYVMNADGSNETRLTASPANDFTPKWTADGSRIYWGVDGEIHSIKPNGTDEQVLSLASTGASNPAPSPDGERIAFDGDGGMYTVRLDGSDLTFLPETSGQDTRPDWQPLSEPPAYAGDADCDGDVDAVDALHILRSVAQLPSSAGCLANANVKCDDSMTSVDSLMILRHVALLEVNLPQGCPAIGDLLQS
jgi:Tol biopolymer transport system component